MLINCFRCDKVLEPADPKGGRQPYEGTMFLSYGNYGSTVFDPQDSSLHLELVLCDECLLANKANILLSKKFMPTPPIPKYQFMPWDPSIDPDEL